MDWSLTGEQKVKATLAGAFILAMLIIAIVTVQFVTAGEGTPGPPPAEFEFTYNDTIETLTITHTAGDRINASRVLISVTSETKGSVTDRIAWNSATLNGETSYSINGAPAIGEGDSVRVSASTAGAVPATHQARVIWQTERGTLILAKHPD